MGERYVKVSKYGQSGVGWFVSDSCASYVSSKSAGVNIPSLLHTVITNQMNREKYTQIERQSKTGL